MKKILLIIVLFCSTLLGQEPTPVLQRPTSADRETTWSAYLSYIAPTHSEIEYTLPGGARVDILTDDVAWEVEWCNKWPESIGQSLYYGAATNRKPGVWLLKKKEHTDEDWNECLSVINYLRGKGIDIQFKTEIVK